MKEIKVVIGANYGDEGKGLMTDYFAHKAADKDLWTLGILSNGGAQRGHTVELHTTKHVFHHFSSGTLAGADTYFAPQFMLNPFIFNLEYDELKNLCPSFKNNKKAYVHPNCRVTTIYDILFNRLIENHRGDNRHGSCGLGIYETFNRCNTRYGFRFGDVCNDKEKLIDALWRTKEYFFKRAHDLKLPTDMYKAILNDNNYFTEYIDEFLKMRKHLLLVTKPRQFVKKYDVGIIENGQGLLLSQEREGEHLTPSYTGARNLIDSLEDYDSFKDIPTELCYVTRTYVTRHGAGPLVGECLPCAIKPSGVFDATNQPNPYQGKLRFGYILLETLKQDICNDSDWLIKTNKNITRSIVVTHLNESQNHFVTPFGANSDLSFADTADKVYLSFSPFVDEIKEVD